MREKLVKQISNLLKNKWGYSKHQIDVYFQVLQKENNNVVTVEV